MAEEPQTEQLSEEVKTLIRGANFGHLATLPRPDRISSRIDCSVGLRMPSARRCAMPAKPCLKAFWLPGGPDLPRMPAMTSQA